MANDNFPFAFDAEKIKEMFSATKLPGIDADAVLATQKKNMDALIEANQVVVAGYQDVFKRQIALFESAFADAKVKLTDAKGQTPTAEQATQNVEAVKTAFEKAAADVKELADLAQKANTGAFEIVKARAEEAVAEFKTAAEKAAA
jgi:phasin family protein